MKIRNQILLAESESIVASDLKQLIQRWGLGETIVARSDKHTHQVAEKTSPRCARVDEGLWGVENGEETAAFLNENYQIPVIFLVNLESKKVQERRQNHQNFFCLAKPFVQDELKEVLEKIMNLQKN